MMSDVVTVGSLVHFTLRWGGFVPLIGGLGFFVLAVFAASESDNPEDSSVGWGSLGFASFGLCMEIAAFFVH